MGPKKMDTDDNQLLPKPKRIRLTDPKESDSDYNTASQDTTAKCVSEFIDVSSKKCLPRKIHKEFAEEFPRLAVDCAQSLSTS